MNPLSDDATLHAYLKEITNSHPLSREKEIELSEKIKAGDLKARDELVQANLRFAVTVAKSYQRRGLSLPELISAANLGLLIAAERFDGSKGYKFISYAVWWIRQSILSTLAEQTRAVHLPQNKISLLKKITLASNQLAQNTENDPDIDEIANELELSTEEVENTLLSGQFICSLDEIFEQETEKNLLSILVDTTEENPDAIVSHREVITHIQNVLKELDEREKFVIEHYFGLNGNEPLALEKIGNYMGVTRERVRQIKERTLIKLRHPSKQKHLKVALEEM